MTKKSLRVPDYLSHILDAIRRIERYTREKSQSEFIADDQLQDAIVRNIEIIGEAARNIEKHSPQFVVATGLVDLGAVWQVVERDLPILRAQIQELLPNNDHGGIGGSQ